jgi:uncharacterized membrane protein
VFSVALLVAALGALSYEMVEDNFVNLIYARMFGWRTLLVAFVGAALVVVPLAVVFVLLAPRLFESYLPLVVKAAALLLIGVGIGWLGFAVFRRVSEPDEVKEAKERAGLDRRSVGLATQLMVVEESEIVVILIPLAVAGHSAEAALTGVAAASLALGMALTLRKVFDKLVSGRLRLLKAISGVALIALGLVLFLD